MSASLSCISSSMSTAEQLSTSVTSSSTASQQQVYSHDWALNSITGKVARAYMHVLPRYAESYTRVARVHQRAYTRAHTIYSVRLRRVALHTRAAMRGARIYV